MKKLFVFAAVVVLLFLVLPVSNLIVGTPSNALAEASVTDPTLKKVLPILGKKCASCHVKDCPLPFYAKLPVASGMIQADVNEGLAYVDYASLIDEKRGPADEVLLAKTQYVVEAGEMPPGRYLLLHWNGGLGGSEKTEIMEWIREVRLAHYSTGTAAEAFAAEVVQPLPDRVEVDERKVALGKKLFHDERLSKDDTLSCASCHALDKGGTDREKFSEGVGGAMGGINSPTVYNSGFQFAQFWDGRAANLEEQAAGPVENPIEMASSWDEVVGKLRKDEEFVKAFTAVYPGGVKKENLLHAIAEFERSLVTPDSAFDRFLKGDESALAEGEKLAYQQFKEIGCANCHVGTLLGGKSYERMGLKADYFGDRGGVNEADHGRYSVTKKESDKFRLKVPTLRNIATTYPYLHDGSTSDLAEVVRIMAKYQCDRSLADTEVKRMVAFLCSLTGKYAGEVVAE